MGTGKMYTNTYVQKSLETHLFYGELLALLGETKQIAEGVLPKDILQSGELLPAYTPVQSGERRPCGDIIDKTEQVHALNQKMLANLYLMIIQKLEKGEAMENILLAERDLLTKLVEINERIIKRLKRMDKGESPVL